LELRPHPNPPKISSKSGHNLLRYAAKCQFMAYLLMAKNPGKQSRIHRRILIATKISLTGPWATPTPPKISSKSVHNFWRYFVHKKQLHRHTDRQTDRQKDTQMHIAT